MPVEVIGWTAPDISSEYIGRVSPVFSLDVLTETARVHQAADFDRVLIGYFAHQSDGFLVGAHTASVTEQLGLLLAHRPGFVAPTLAARKLATLDQMSGGRLAVHIISGGSDVDQAADGDFVDHDGRYRRSTEYVGLLRKMWTSTGPFDHKGEFYEVEGAYSVIACQQVPHIPIYGGGGSDAAIASLAPHLDVFMLWGEPLAETAAMMQRVRASAATVGRTTTFSVSTRPILGRTEGEAWDRAHHIHDVVAANPTFAHLRARQVDNVGSQRLLAAAARAATSTTPASTPHWRRRRAHWATRPRWSAPLRPSPTPSCSTTPSAPPACSSAATTLSPTPKSTAVTSSPVSGSSWPSMTPRSPADVRALLRSP